MNDPAPKGQFWADAIKGLRGDPAARFRLAWENRPYPGAYSEAAVAIRAIIRAKRKAKEDHDRLLGLLHYMAAQYDFLHHTPFIKGVGPGYNVAERVPKKLLDTLEFPYSKVGYRELELLNKTDVKWMLAAWGEPEGHGSAQALHQGVWDHYVNLQEEAQKEEERRFLRMLRGMG